MHDNIMGMEATRVEAAVRRLESRGVEHRRAVRQVARRSATSSRYVRQTLDRVRVGLAASS